MSDGLQQPEKLVLGIDTSGDPGSLALARVPGTQEIELLALRTVTGRNFSAELLPCLRDLLSQTDTALPRLSAVVVVSGPGSFTGLRIGISTAKALAHAAAIPIIAVSRLQIMLSFVEEDTVAVLEAGRGEFYVGIRTNAHRFSESLEVHAGLAEKVDGRALCICEPQLLERLQAFHPVLVGPPNAYDAIRFAQQPLFSQTFDDLATLDANYVRRPYQQATAEASSEKANAQ